VSETGYIFIGGLPRTGTTLMRSLLNCSDQVGISLGEARLFPSPRFFGLLKRDDFRQTLARIGDIGTETGLNKIVDFLYDSPQNNFWGVIPQQVSRADLLNKLRAAPHRERALFELGMILGAEGKPLAGEKTPAHIYYVPELLAWFPNAKVIHTFRDPRAVYVSEKRKYDVKRRETQSWAGVLARQTRLIFELYASLDIIANWLRAIRLHRKYQRLYPERYIAIRYEDVVSEPEPQLRKLCDFLGIDFNEAMLQQTVLNSSFVSASETVKGFDTSALNRWRQNVHPLVGKWFRLWCKKQLLEFGYQL
jgi:hypothetical protein